MFCTVCLTLCNKRLWFYLTLCSDVDCRIILEIIFSLALFFHKLKSSKKKLAYLLMHWQLLDNQEWVTGQLLSQLAVAKSWYFPDNLHFLKGWRLTFVGFLLNHSPMSSTLAIIEVGFSWGWEGLLLYLFLLWSDWKANLKHDYTSGSPERPLRGLEGQSKGNMCKLNLHSFTRLPQVPIDPKKAEERLWIQWNSQRLFAKSLFQKASEKI